ncbi:hypothetical protein GE09DRAFT_1212650 [Coniochaeta sp. 2T2.1]|nr:hypothetical protein GE09DRAFT_1212650 [Coniochaeta sp. 2T2.1]
MPATQSSQDDLQPKRQKLDDTAHSTNGGDKDVDETIAGTQLSGEDSTALKWMDEEAVSVLFGSDKLPRAFPGYFLTNRFAYFRSALRKHGDSPTFSEGVTRKICLQDIAAHTFARIARYALSSKPSDVNFDKAGITEPHDTVTSLLDALIAADYLGMDAFTSFEKMLAERLALLLLFSRLSLSSDHTRLIASHTAFRSKLIWRVVVASGVRPFLQEHISPAPDHGCGSDKIPPPAHCMQSLWKCILVHCRQLRSDDKKYGLDVAAELSTTLKDGVGFKAPPYSYNLEPTPYVDPLLAFVSIDLSRTCYGEKFGIMQGQLEY